MWQLAFEQVALQEQQETVTATLGLSLSEREEKLQADDFGYSCGVSLEVCGRDWALQQQDEAGDHLFI